MAITGTFTADFSSFYDAVTKAEISLRAFEASSVKVESQLTRMVDSFTGRKIISEATLAAEAVERIGGVSNLTKAELARVSAIAGEAAEKLRAMGQDVPPGIQRIADSAKNLQKAFSEFDGDRVLVKATDATTALGEATHKSTLEWLAGIPIIGQFVAALSVERLFEFAKGAIESAARLDELEKATGISADTLQRMRYVGEGFGLSMEQIATAVEQLSAKLAGGDQNAVNAVQSLGLSVTRLLAAGPKEAFLQIAEAAGRVEDPMMKNAIAADLFGGKLGKTLVPLLGELRQKMEEVPKAALISDENIKKASEFETGLKHGLTAVEALTVGLVSGAASIISYVEKLREIPSQLIVTATAWVTGAKAASDYADTLKRTADIELPHVITNAELLQNELAALRAQALVPLTEAQKDAIIELESFGVSQAKIAQLLGTTEAAVHRAIAAYNAQSDAIHEQYVAIGQLEDAYFKLHLNAIKGIQALTDAMQRELIPITKAVNEAVSAEFEAQTKLNRAQGLDAYGAIQLQSTALDTYQRALNALHATKQEGISQSAQEQVLLKALEQQLYDEAVAQDKARDASAGHNVELAKIPALAAEAAGSLQGLVVTAQELIDAYAKAGFITHQPISGIPPPGATGTGAPGSLVFAPSKLAPASAAFGSSTGMVVNVAVNGSVLGNKDEIARAVGDAFMQRLRGTGSRVAAK